MPEWTDFLLYATSVCVSFVAVFLKGFQHKNVIGNHMRTIFFTSYAMAAFDVAAVGIIVAGGWPIAITSGTGAAFGMISSIKLHDLVFGRKM
jgi:hypothetical protein